MGVGPNDSLVFVFDVVDAFDGDQSAEGTPVEPDCGLPDGRRGRDRADGDHSGDRRADRARLQVLIEGDGAEVETGQLLVVQYRGAAVEGRLRSSTRAGARAPRPPVPDRDRQRHPGLGQGAGRPDGRQPGSRRRPACRGLRRGGEPAGDRRRRHARVRRRHPRRVRRRRADGTRPASRPAGAGHRREQTPFVRRRRRRPPGRSRRASRRCAAGGSSPSPR